MTGKQELVHDVCSRKELFLWDFCSEAFQNLLDFPLTNRIAICYI